MCSLDKSNAGNAKLFGLLENIGINGTQFNLALMYFFFTYGLIVLYAWFYIAWATGNIIGPQTFRADQAPEYTGGTVAMIVCYIIAMFAITSYGIICHSDNKKRAEAIESRMAADQDWLDLTDRENKGFKYTT
ncbi:Major facilitator superfamily domain general substrate transporter [Penicillium waksmanii]|uniref:Major facilitator superfamily domain general substrate transporter n=1 Tax=Penicillium waksmanii TaxID=69791 RepID=UPI002547D156|nr:Major facilitator superfamily domain general substrate transporter [Penicillium waksmanii]KAJ5983823.1 Major facilitator superfamily domain general substrate transporter [Penicillium waksmanii]